MFKEKDLIIALVGNGLFSAPLPDDFPKSFSIEDAGNLYKIAKSHDLAHVVASALKKNGVVLPPEVEAKFQKQLFMAVFRVEKLQYELKRISDVFEAAKVPFIPLKGSVLRPYYPESWMRTSCDIDVLVKPADMDRAGEALVTEIGYRAEGQWNGERSFYSPDGIHLELHFYDEEDREEGEIFREIWEHVSPAEGKTFYMQIEWEYFYAHHVMHMAKHFSHGGCGIRPFADLTLMLDKLPLEASKKREYMEKFRLTAFSENAELLSSVWFGNAEHTALTKQMEEYLLGAGIYGSIENQVALEKSGKSKHLSGFFAHVWVPYDVIKHQYPILLRHKWLLPFCQIRRWFKLIFCGGLKRSMVHVRENRNVSKEKVQNVSKLLEQLKLD